MGLLLLLTSLLLYSYFHAGRVVDAQLPFTIRDINLSIEPSTDVSRDTNVTLRCQAVVSSSEKDTLSREYTIFKDGNKIYTKTTSTSEDLLYPLPQARVSNSGKYKCKINIKGKELTSNAKKLTVTGLSRPVLRLNSSEVREGEEVTAKCTAPGETGSIYFYFYDDNKEILERQVISNQAEVNLSLNNVGTHKIHCDYMVLVTPYSFKSEGSNTDTVSVRELSITPVLKISPQYNIYEGDRLTISCSVMNHRFNYKGIHLYLSQGTKLLSTGESRVNSSILALASDPREFECRMEMSNVVKVDNMTVSVTALFSVPTLKLAPAEVFQREPMTLTCRIESYASERLNKEDLTYSLDPPENPLSSKGGGVFSGRALPYDFNYTCVVQAKDIVKHSKTLTVRPKVAVSIPIIKVVGKAILHQPFEIQCQSDVGSLPINYTLFKDLIEVDTKSVLSSNEKALFPVTINQPAEIKKFMCEARNGQKEAQLSRNLYAAVVVPLSHPVLTSIPREGEIFEEGNLVLMCSVNGTAPVTFLWYRNEQHLNTTFSNKDHTDYQIPYLTKDHGGTYYCEAFNLANNIVRSNTVIVEVRMALWKKGLIGGICLLAVLVLVVVLVVCFRSKRVKVDKAAVSVWSNRPPESVEDEESSVESNEPDVEYTEVVHPQPADPDRAPLRKGTDTVYSELQNAPHGAANHHDYGSVEYAELNGEQPETNLLHPKVNSYQDLPEPVD